MKRRKLKWYGYVTRSSGLAKTAGNSSRRETKRQTEETMGRQHQKWTGHKWNIILKAENREEWRKLVVKIYSGTPMVSQTTG